MTRIWIPLHLYGLWPWACILIGLISLLFIDTFLMAILPFSLIFYGIVIVIARIFSH